MVCKCCNYDAYDAVFSEKSAKKELKKYKKKGLGKETKILYELLKPKVSGISVVELGSGIGTLAVNLTIAGASKYYGSEISGPSLKMAKVLVKEEGLDGKIVFSDKDLVENDFEKSDLVLSDKVVCCYPYMEKFVNASVSHAKRYYAIVYPKDNLFTKGMFKFANFFMQFTKRKGFKVYLHDTKKINEIIESYGFKRTSKGETFIMEILVFEKT
jgi:predicted RNA methylase